MNSEVWVVTGECGEYSDTSWWIVRVFTDRGAAQAFADSLNRWVSEQNQRDKTSDDLNRWNEEPRPKQPPGDPNSVPHIELTDPTTIVYDVEAAPVDWLPDPPLAAA